MNYYSRIEYVKRASAMERLVGFVKELRTEELRSYLQDPSALSIAQEAKFGSYCIMAYAAMLGHKAALETLLDAGISADGAGEGEVSPLGWCAFKGHVECLRLLLDKGADPNKANRNGDTPLMWAALREQTLCARILLQHNVTTHSTNGTGMNALMCAARSGCSDLISPLLAVESDGIQGFVCQGDNDGCTVGHIAALANHFKFIAELFTQLQSHQSVLLALLSTTNKRKRTMLEVARACGAVEAADMIAAEISRLDAVVLAAWDGEVLASPQSRKKNRKSRQKHTTARTRKPANHDESCELPNQSTVIETQSPVLESELTAPSSTATQTTAEFPPQLNHHEPESDFLEQGWQDECPALPTQRNPITHAQAQATVVLSSVSDVCVLDGTSPVAQRQGDPAPNTEPSSMPSNSTPPKPISQPRSSSPTWSMVVSGGRSARTTPTSPQIPPILSPTSLPLEYESPPTPLPYEPETALCQSLLEMRLETASALCLRGRHVMGADLDCLSMSQLDGLEKFHMRSLKAVSEAKARHVEKQLLEKDAR